MIPQATHPAWAELIKGERRHEFALTSASLLFFNLQYAHQRDPSKLGERIDEARRFFEKYEKILAEDITRLFNS
jgi:hypothetical protein